MSTTGQNYLSNNICLLIAFSLVTAPIMGCSQQSESDTAAEVSVSEMAASGAPATADSSLGAAWQFITETTDSGLTIVSEKCLSGASVVLDAGKTVWIWSADTTADGWGWIVENAADATQWASDTAGQTWAITQQKSGEFSLWVQIKANRGIAWARTTIPATWRVVKDSAGQAWVWIDEHKVEIAVAAAVVAVVAAGLLIAPEGVAPAVVKGAVAGSASQATIFLLTLFDLREYHEHGPELRDISSDVFLSIGRSVLTECGAQVLGSFPVGAS